MDINLIPSILLCLQEDGLTQSEIGEAIGCSQSTVSDMMTGKSGLKRPSYEIVSGLELLARQRGIAFLPAGAEQPTLARKNASRREPPP